MQKLLGSLAVIVTLAVAGSAVACQFHESASADQTVTTAQAPASSTAPAGGAATTPKTQQGQPGG